MKSHNPLGKSVGKESRIELIRDLENLPYLQDS